MKKVKILVLGMGGNVSQGIVKAIKNSSLDCEILGACISHESAGLYMCDSAFIAPYANSANFMTWLIDICNSEKVDIVLTGVEENIIEIAKNITRFRAETNTIFISTNYESLLIGQDKYKTVEWLKANGFNYPKFAIATELNSLTELFNSVGYPLIAKPIKGKGSQGILVINNENDLEKVKGDEKYIVQEYIGSSSTEYTVGCYKNKNGKVLTPIIMHRELQNGTTFKAEIVDNEEIKKETMAICEKFDGTGPLNIQLRLDKNNRPVCFELNVRFSGTTPMRAHYGFNDVEALIKEYVFNEVADKDFDFKKGIAYRYITEVYSDVADVETLKNDKILKTIDR